MRLHIPNWYTLRTEGITQSLLSKYLACPRRFLIAVNGYCEKPRMTMLTGTVGHAGIEAAYKGESWERKIQRFDFEPHVVAKEREIIKAINMALVPGYIDYWKKQGNPWRKLKPEVKFDVRLGQYRMRGKRDGVYTDKAHETGILEIKFKGRISEDELDERLTLDGQSLFYLLATHLERQLYPTSVIYDVIRFPARKAGDVSAKDIYQKLVKDIKKNPEYYFYRWRTEFKPRAIEDFRLELEQKFNEIDGRSVWYRNEFACYQPYRCPFMRFCVTGRPEGLQTKQLFSELDDDIDE